MIRVRHAGQLQTRPEANEIILINSHDGASSYQMLAGMFRLCPAVQAELCPAPNYVQLTASCPRKSAPARCA